MTNSIASMVPAVRRWRNPSAGELLMRRVGEFLSCGKKRQAWKPALLAPGRAGFQACHTDDGHAEQRIHSRGVTLLELLVVVALASIMLALVFPSVGSSLQGLELSSAARRLAEASRYARDEAVFRQSTFELEIDSATRTVSVANLEQAPSSARRFELPASVRIARILPEQQEEAEGGPRRFLFMPDGVAPQFQVVLADRRREVTVWNDPLTGAATVSPGAPGNELPISASDTQVSAR